MLDRYKKKGGFTQLLQLIETSGKQKQEQFLGLIAQESPAWEEAIRKKTLTIDKVLAWNPAYLSEVFSRINILTLASAFHGQPEQTIAIVFKAISTTDQRKFQMTMQELNPTPAEKASSQMKILSETRAMIAKGIIKLDKVDPELDIPENFEQKLAEAGFSSSAMPSAPPSSAASPASSSSSENPGTDLKFDNIEFRSETKNESAREEIDFLKKKVNQLVNENNMLKHELSVLRNKIEQIRKIA